MVSVVMSVLTGCFVCVQAIVAAFAVSGYSSTYYRAGSKPFNPLLGETYECIREDKGFCFFSEQVQITSYFITHTHPSCSTCSRWVPVLHYITAPLSLCVCVCVFADSKAINSPLVKVLPVWLEKSLCQHWTFTLPACDIIVCS